MRIDDGIISDASASASSGVCLYLNVSRAAGAADGALDGLEAEVAGAFFTGAADVGAAAAAGGFLAWKGGGGG